MKSELDENGEKHVILCRLTLGNVEKMEPDSKQSHPSGVNYDTGVDDPENPKWYVTWSSNMSTHVLPEFVVSFKPSDPAQGEHDLYILEAMIGSSVSILLKFTVDNQ